jgi:hypothetical protein
MLAKIRLPYDLKVTLQTFEDLKEYIPGLQLKEIEDYKNWDDKDLIQAESKYNDELEKGLRSLKGYTEGVVHVNHFMSKFPALTFEVLQVIKHTETDSSMLVNKLDSITLQLISKIDSFEKSKDSFEKMFNQKCNVHLPGIGLLTINEVIVEYDFCTEALQKKLLEGWRVLAICPQPDQRRPDYILGRTI